jgi:subtilase family serine protease
MVSLCQNLPKLPKRFLNAVGFNPGEFSFEESLFPQTTTTTTTLPTTTNSSTKDGGFWNVDLNTLLDFAKDGINNYAIIVKSKSDEAVMANAVALEQEKGTSFKPTDTSNSKTKYVILGVAAIAIVGLSIWYFKKAKK